MPAAIAAATLASLKIIENEPQRRSHLQNLIVQFKQGAEQIGLQLMSSDTAIQPVIVGDSAKAMAMSAQLKERGIMVTAIRPPTVPAGTARLRITLSAAHSTQQVAQLLSALEQINKQEHN